MKSYRIYMRKSPDSEEAPGADFDIARIKKLRHCMTEQTLKLLYIKPIPGNTGDPVGCTNLTM